MKISSHSEAAQISKQKAVLFWLLHCNLWDFMNFVAVCWMFFALSSSEIFGTLSNPTFLKWWLKWQNKVDIELFHCSNHNPLHVLLRLLWRLCLSCFVHKKRSWIFKWPINSIGTKPSPLTLVKGTAWFNDHSFVPFRFLLQTPLPSRFPWPWCYYFSKLNRPDSLRTPPTKAEGKIGKIYVTGLAHPWRPFCLWRQSGY